MLNPSSADGPRVAKGLSSRLALVTLGVSMLAVVAAGCTSSYKTGSTTTKTTVDAAAKCTVWATVASAFTTLQNGNVTSGDKAIALRNIHKLQKADKDFRPTVTKDVKKAITDLQTSIHKLAVAVRDQAHGGTASVSAAATGVRTSWNALVAAVGPACPSVTATTVAP